MAFSGRSRARPSLAELTCRKAALEAGIKAGYVVSDQVLSVEPRTPLDGSIAKSEAITRQIEGTLVAASSAQIDRAEIRTMLGSPTLQVLQLP